MDDSRIIIPYSIQNALISDILGVSVFDAPESLYVGLSLHRANELGSVLEPSAPCYSRVYAGEAHEVFDRAQLGMSRNVEAVEFPTPEREWGRVQSMFIADGREPDARVLFLANLPNPTRPLVGLVPRFEAGTIRFSPFA